MANPKPSSPQGLTSLPRNVWAVTAASFFNDISSEMITNLIPLFLANILGVRMDVIGLIEGVAESTASLLKIFSGWFSDRISKRKELAVLGYAISTVAKPFLYVVTGWPGVLGVRFADRVGKGIRTAPRDALIADTVSNEQRGLAFGLHRAGDTAGAFAGLLVALLVVWISQSGAVSLDIATFRRIVLIGIIPAVAAVLILGLLARDVQISSNKTSDALRLGALSPTFKRFLVVIFIFTLGNSADAFLILRAQERGLNVIGVLGMLASFNLIYALLSGPLGALSDRVGRRRVIVVGWLIYACLYLGFAIAQLAWHIWLLYTLYGMYYAAVEGTARAYIADIVPSTQRGTAYGAYNAAVGIGALPASLIAGILWQGTGSWGGFGPSAPFFAGAGLAFLAIVLFTIWIPSHSSV